MSSNDWQFEMHRLLEIFERESTNSLRKISRCFVTLDRPFDEHFRKYFLRVSSLRLDTSFNTILMEQFYENQTQTRTVSNSNGVVQNANIPSSNGVGRMDVLDNENSPNLKIERDAAAPIGIADSDDGSGELEYSETQVASDQKELQGTVKGPNDDDKLTQEQNESTSVNGNGIDVDVKPKIEIEPEAAEMDLEFVEFNPNEDNDRLTIENGATTVAESSLIDQNQASSSVTVQKPLNGETSDKPFECSDCAYAFKFKSSLKRHQRIHVQQKLLGIVQWAEDETMDLPLEVFDPNKITDSSSLSGKNGDGSVAEVLVDQGEAISSPSSQKQEKQSDGKRFKCNDCEYSSNRTGHFRSHQLIHQGVKPFKCELCDYAARQKFAFIQHQRVHERQELMGIGRDPNDGLFKCTHCDQRFLKWNGLTKHLKCSHKNNQRLFNCMHCMRRFKQRTEKERHEIQCQNCRYECYLCKSYVTRNVSKMQEHMRTHSGVKPFQCPICHQCFSQKVTLKYHLNSIHSHTT